MSDQGLRYDEGKNQLALISPLALWEIGRIYTMGARKYTARNWEKGMPYTKTMDAALRHIVKWLAGHRNDEESGLHHLAHAAWNLIALLHYELGNYDMGLLDDRSFSSKRVPNSSEAMPKEVDEQLNKQLKEAVERHEQVVGQSKCKGSLAPMGVACPCEPCTEARARREKINAKIIRGENAEDQPV